MHINVSSVSSTSAYFFMNWKHCAHFNNSVVLTYSGVARAFPCGQTTHPEYQIEEQNEEKLRKKWRKIIEEWGNVPLLPARGWESSYAPHLLNYAVVSCPILKWYKVRSVVHPFCCFRPRENIQIFPQCILAICSTPQDQITFLFLCTENHYFHIKKRLTTHGSLVQQV